MGRVRWDPGRAPRLGRPRQHGRIRGRQPNRAHRRDDRPHLESQVSPVEHLLGESGQWRLFTARNSRGLPERPRRVLRPGRLQWPQHLRPLPLAGSLPRSSSLGAGLFSGRRQNLGNELDHDLYASEAVKLTGRTQLKRLPNRGSHDAETIHAILDAGFLAHVGFQVDGQPFVIPTLCGRDGDKLYLHGLAASRMVRRLAAGVPACVTVTLVDGIVLARSAFHHSMNYRSVTAFGTARLIDSEEEKTRGLRVVSEHLMPRRWDDVRGPSVKELKATAVLEFTIDEASAKVRTGPPVDDEPDYELAVWAGVLPLSLRAGDPVPDERLANG